ncbi:DUF4172 domain-containing protein, partial [Acuticoccus sediminis]
PSGGPGRLVTRLDTPPSSNRHHPASVHSSQLGLDTDNRNVKPKERGIAEMMVDLYRTWANPLDADTLFRWHGMLMADTRHLETIGGYRRHQDAMQIVSGRQDRPTVHFEAPPSSRVPEEMTAYLAWFNGTSPDGDDPLPALTRAGIGHIYFESIHPFEDGNGRIGRTLAEKSLAQNIGQPTLIALAHTIERHRKAYYDQLEVHQRTLDVTGWLMYFAERIIAAQRTTLGRVAFHIAKAHFYDRFRGMLNERQEKAIARLFREGPGGFTGGLSAENYLAITGTSRPTATRDLHDLVEKGALTRTGERRYTRYHLNLPGTAVTS